MKNKGKFLILGISGALFALLIVLLCCVDVEPVGAAGTSVGLSHMNRFVFELTGVNMVWYNITDWLGLAAIFAAFLFAATGLVQVIKRRSILKVDKEILALGGLYILVIGIYVLFENVIVNYIPIIMPGCSNPEASFPSSHTMLVCVIMGSTIIIIGKYIKKKSLCMVIRGICAAVIAVTVVGRLISGVHWFTDIIGGLLISTFLLVLYFAFVTWEE